MMEVKFCSFLLLPSINLFLLLKKKKDLCLIGVLWIMFSCGLWCFLMILLHDNTGDLQGQGTSPMSIGIAVYDAIKNVTIGTEWWLLRWHTQKSKCFVRKQDLLVSTGYTNLFFLDSASSHCDGHDSCLAECRSCNFCSVGVRQNVCSDLQAGLCWVVLPHVFKISAPSTALRQVKQ